MMFGGSYVVDNFSLVLKGLFIGAAFVAILLSVGYIESDRFWQGEFYFLLLASVVRRRRDGIEPRPHHDLRRLSNW